MRLQAGRSNRVRIKLGITLFMPLRREATLARVKQSWPQPTADVAFT